MTRRFACLLILLSGAAQAQVYKCTNPDGTVSFSDKPCSASAEVVQGLDDGTSGLGQSAGGPPSSLTMGDGSILRFKRLLQIQVQTETGFKTGRGKLYVFYEGTDREIAFDQLKSLYVTSWDRDYCGNLAHLCEPRVRIVTGETTLNTRYKALRSLTVLIDDELDGQEKEMVVWFGIDNRPRIRAIRF